MPPIDDAIDTFERSLEQAEQEFLKDVGELEKDGLSATEILAFIAAIDIAAYFIEDLGMSAGINAYMASTGSILDGLPFFGAATERELVALQAIQQASITQLTTNVGQSVRMSISQGVANGLGVSAIADLVRRDMPRVDAVIATTLGKYQQSIIGIMASALPENTRWSYIGPRDELNRPLCREFLDESPLTYQQIEAKNTGSFLDRGGYNCRHQWLPS